MLKKKKLTPSQLFRKLMDEDYPELKPLHRYLICFIGRGTQSIYNGAIRRLQEIDMPKEAKDKVDALIVGMLKI